MQHGYSNTRPLQRFARLCELPLCRSIPGVEGEDRFGGKNVSVHTCERVCMRARVYLYLCVHACVYWYSVSASHALYRVEFRIQMSEGLNNPCSNFRGDNSDFLSRILTNVRGSRREMRFEKGTVELRIMRYKWNTVRYNKIQIFEESTFQPM